MRASFGVKEVLLDKVRLDLSSPEPRGASGAVADRSAFEYPDAGGPAVGVKNLRTLRGCIAAIVLFATFLSGIVAAFAAAADRSPAASEEATPPQIQQLLTLLADPKVETWLKQQNEAKAAAASMRDKKAKSVSHALDSRLGAIREHIVAVADTIPDVPNQFERGAARVSAELGEHGRAKVLLLLAVFVGLGTGVEWLFGKATERSRRHLDALPLQTVASRVHLVAIRFAFAVGMVVAFALGSVGPFLALDWPPLLREMLFGLLIAFLAVRIAIVIGRFLLAPRHERFRIIPMSAVAARFWYRRLVMFVGWFAFGWVWVGLLGTLGWSLEGRQLVAYVLGLGLLAIALEAVWRRPAPLDGSTAASSPVTRRFGHGARNAALSVGIVLLWVLWVAHAMASFWLLLVIITLPLAIGVTRRAVEHLLRPPGSPQIADGAAERARRFYRARYPGGSDPRCGRGTGLGLGYRSRPSPRGGDIVRPPRRWRVERHRHPADRRPAVARHEDGDRSQARRMRRSWPAEHRRGAAAGAAAHLVPIFRNILFVVVIVFAAMMALAALGVQIGPLIAGLGVLGVAIGFGAQSFVRDVIAGMFYLLDDAFRVGEYIQSGNYKGTVEGFSIRSVRLRHQRGPVYTVPFSLLGAVQNRAATGSSTSSRSASPMTAISTRPES